VVVQGMSAVSLDRPFRVSVNRSVSLHALGRRLAGRRWCCRKGSSGAEDSSGLCSRKPRSGAFYGEEVFPEDCGGICHDTP